MDYESKLKAAHQALEDKGVWPSNYNPPMYRLLRKFGVQLTPPYYQTFGKNFITVSITFTIMWFFAFYFIIYKLVQKEIIDVFSSHYTSHRKITRATQWKQQVTINIAQLA